MRKYACGAAMVGMVALAATAASWAADAPGTTNPTTGSATPAGQAAAPTQTPQASPPGQPAPSDQKPQALAATPTCPPAPVHRHVAYHHRVVHSTVGSETYTASYSSAGSYGAQYAVAAAPPPPPVYYAPPPVPVWYAPGPRPWFGAPWHRWWHRPGW